jgi:hypothetical protein
VAIIRRGLDRTAREAIEQQDQELRYPRLSMDVLRECILVLEKNTVAAELHDDETGEQLAPVGIVLPLSPSESRLPWSVENLRLCNHCGQMAQLDLNICPTCSRRMGSAD